MADRIRKALEGWVGDAESVAVYSPRGTVWHLRDDFVASVLDALDKAGIGEEVVADGLAVRRLESGKRVFTIDRDGVEWAVVIDRYEAGCSYSLATAVAEALGEEGNDG